MADIVNYFSYQIPHNMVMFIGTEKDQIINTISYYKNERGQDEVQLPSLDEIIKLNEINIDVAFPMLKIDHCISAEVRDNVFFHVNVNAFVYIQHISRQYECFKRGDLYKFKAGAPVFGLWFLPEYIMKGIKEYDWLQHKQQMGEWMENREKVMNDLEKKGVIARPKLFSPPIIMN